MKLLTGRWWVFLPWLFCLVWAWAEVTRKPVEPAPVQVEAWPAPLSSWGNDWGGGAYTGVGSQAVRVWRVTEPGAPSVRYGPEDLAKVEDCAGGVDYDCVAALVTQDQASMWYFWWGDGAGHYSRPPARCCSYGTVDRAVLLQQELWP